MNDLVPVHRLIEQTIGRRVSPPTVWRWIKHGILIGDRRVKLKAVKVGRSVYSKPEWMREFIEAQSGYVNEDSKEERDSIREKELQDAGLL